MTKLDEAVEAAIEALCSDKNVDVFAKDDGEEYIELDCGHSMSVAMKAAIQAAVKVLEGSIINMPDGAEIAICQIHTLSRPEIEK